MSPERRTLLPWPVPGVAGLFSFGRHTRLMFFGYLRQVFLVAMVLLAVALTIDLWPQIDLLSGGSEGGVAKVVWSILRFSALRLPGLLAPLVPIATFLAVVATEVAHTRQGERMLVWNSGRSPLHCLTPVLLLGCLMGVVEFTLDAYLSPAAMAVQMQERLGRDGQRLDRTRIDDTHWIASPEGPLNTRIVYGPPAVLRNLRFFRLDERGSLAEIDEAAEAHQLPGADRWLMRDGRYWMATDVPGPAGAPGGGGAAGQAGSEKLIPFAERTVRLTLDSLWLSYFGVEAQYLPLPVLERLARSDLVPTPGLFRTRLQVLYAGLLMPGAVALLASSLSMVLLAYRTPPRAVTGIMLAGYMAHAAMKACLLMGQNDYLPPMVAGWFVPLTLLGVSFATFRVIERQRRGIRSAGRFGYGEFLRMLSEE